MTATPEQLALVRDPSTPAAALAELAYAERSLWPLIARHPNVYPDLIEWMRTYGLPEPEEPTDPAVESKEVAGSSDGPVRTKVAPPNTPQKTPEKPWKTL